MASNVDPTLAPEGRHVMTCFVQYVPYRLKPPRGTWDENRELLGDRVVRKIAEYAPNVPGSVVARQVLTPLDLERTYGLTEGNIFHGDLLARAALLHAAGRRLGALPHAGRGPLPVRRRRASGRRRDRRARAQRGAPGPEGLEAEGRVSVESDLQRSADVVILGAGVMGASIAFHLARRGAGRILVLDKGDVAHGGSGRSSALVRMHYSFPPEVDLAVKSLEIFRTWKDYVGRPGDFRQTGFVRIVPEKELPRLEKNVAMQRAHGVDARVVDRARARRDRPRLERGRPAATPPGSRAPATGTAPGSRRTFSSGRGRWARPTGRRRASPASASRTGA